jgi:ribosomal protein S18 acetylase RimI-like enzyme
MRIEQKMITIHQAEKDDIQAIYAFDLIAIDNLEYRREIIATSVESGSCYVADMDGKVVGYAVLDYTFYSNGMIDMLYIHPEYRRKGIGEKLVRHIESLRKTEKLFTSTNQSNLPMQGLLNKLGYVPSGFIDNLDEGDPEVVYFKMLKKDR